MENEVEPVYYTKWALALAVASVLPLFLAAFRIGSLAFVYGLTLSGLFSATSLWIARIGARGKLLLIAKSTATLGALIFAVCISLVMVLFLLPSGS